MQTQTIFYDSVNRLPRCRECGRADVRLITDSFGLHCSLPVACCQTIRERGAHKPRPGRMADLLTPKTEVAIRSIANRRKVNYFDQCERVFGCLPAELTKWAAGAFIRYLRTL